MEHLPRRQPGATLVVDTGAPSEVLSVARAKKQGCQLTQC